MMLILDNKNTFIILLKSLINITYHINNMSEAKPIDFDKEKPFNLTLILEKTDEFIDMLEKLDIAYPVFSHAIKRTKELKYRYELVRQRKTNLFTY